MREDSELLFDFSIPAKEQTAWVIFNAAGHRWGPEVFASEAAARAELKAFWKGVSGVDLSKLYVREFPQAEASSVKMILDFRLRAWPT